jgi:putative ABC transport system permease protein
MISTKLRVTCKASTGRALALGVVLIVTYWFSGLLSQVMAQRVKPGGQMAAGTSDLPPMEPAYIEVRSVMSATPPQTGVESPRRTIDVGLRYIEFERLVATVPAIKKALPIRENPMRIRRPGLILDGRVVGTTHDFAEFNRLRMERGRFLTDADDAKCRSYAVLGSEAAKTLFPSDDPVGQLVNVGSDSFTVIGVAKQRASGGLKRGSDRDIYVPLNTSKARFGEWIRNTRAERSLVFQLSRIVVVLRKDAKVQETVPLISSILKPFNHRGAVEVVGVIPEGETK